MTADTKKESQSEQSKPSEELAHVKRQNKLILAAAGEGIYGIDIDGFVTFVNPAAADLLDWGP